jgi:hypothetical protein
MTTSRRGGVIAACALCALAACGGTGGRDGGDDSATARDSGIDSGVDSGIDSAAPADAGIDSALDSTTAGTCGAGVPAGQACNALTDVATAITPTCVSGTIPTGQGGTIVEGTYVLTAQTYYNLASCQNRPALSETIEITGGCLQLVSRGPFPTTASGAFTVAGSSIMVTQTCLRLALDGATLTPDGPNKTFTATPTTFTLFTNNSATGNPNPDTVDVFTKR